MKSWRKAGAVLLTASMLMGTVALTGCNSKKKKGETVPEDTPWYNVEEIDISSAYNSMYQDLEYLGFNYIGNLDGNYVMSVDGSMKIPDDFDWEHGNWRDYQISDIAVIDAAGSLVNRIDIMSITDGDNEYIQNFSFVDGQIQAQLVSYDTRTWDQEVFSLTIDPITGTVGDRIAIEAADDTQSENESNEGSVPVGDYSITKYWKYGETLNTYRLAITDADGNLTSLDMERLFPGLEVYNIDSILDCGNNQALILASGDGNMVFDLDLNSMTITQKDESDVEWLKKVNTYALVNVNGSVYTVDTDGVKALDFDSQEVNDVFSFDNCNINRYDAQRLQLIDADEDEYIFILNDYAYYQYIADTNSYSIVKITKADSNPNAGKEIISLSCLSGISESVADAITEFNNTNGEFFIQYNNDYDNTYDFDYDDSWSEEDWNNAIMNSQADMSNQLAMDLMNGEGPDIILGGFMYGQLNNENYLMDISDYIDDYGSEGFFTNVFEGSKTGDKIFQLPLSFYISGILTDRMYVDNGQTGFTYDQYLRFVDEVCNGKDPIREGRISYFTECLNAMNDLFFDGNNVDYNNDAFRNLAEYCLNNVNDQYDFGSEGDVVYFDEEWHPDPAQWSSFSGFSSYLNAYNSENGPQSQVILGLPSEDGRGPAISTSDSAAISAQASSPDACWEFIKILLGSDTQELIAKGWAFPVNVDAFETVARQQIDGYNRQVRDGSNYSYSGMGMIEAVELDYSIIDSFETECIATAHVVSSDPSITVIISEEIPAYFSGQKSIDDVVDILENRVNTVLNERG